jgi:hypothetical protein
LAAFQVLKTLIRESACFVTSLGLARCLNVYIGPTYRDLLAETVQQLVEDRDALPQLQAVHMLHEFPLPEKFPDFQDAFIAKGADFVGYNSLGDEKLLLRHHRTFA